MINLAKHETCVTDINRIHVNIGTFDFDTQNFHWFMGFFTYFHRCLVHFDDHFTLNHFLAQTSRKSLKFPMILSSPSPHRANARISSKLSMSLNFRKKRKNKTAVGRQRFWWFFRRRHCFVVIFTISSFWACKKFDELSCFSLECIAKSRDIYFFVLCCVARPSEK